MLGTGLDRAVILFYFAIVIGFGATLANIARQQRITFLEEEDFHGGSLLFPLLLQVLDLIVS